MIFRERKYRILLLPLGVALTVGMVLGVQLLRLLGAIDGPLGYMGLTDAMLIGAMWVLSLVCWAAFPEYVGPDGLRATDGLGRYHEVPWEDIRSVSSFLGFLWVRHGKLGKALCFPKYLDQGSDFREYVLQHAPDGNPLRAFLLRASGI